MSGFNSSPPGAAKLVAAATDEPLGLTVHSMPSPQQAMADQGRRTARGRWTMVIVLLLCAAPVIASYFTYYVVRPEGRRVFGELIDPQRPLPDQPARLVLGLTDAASTNLRALKGQWLLITVANAACDVVCQQQLYLQRQLRESTGREKDRIDRVWLVADDQPVPESLRPALASATVLRVPAEALARWLAPEAGHTLNEHMYVVDPLGNWMMRFPARMDAAGASKAKRDIERLLRASASWDEPGR